MGAFLDSSPRDITVYVSIGVALILSLIIVCLQCKIIYLQRIMVRSGITRKGSKKKSQGESSISPSSDQLVDAISSPDNNTALEMTELQQENPSAPHTNSTPSRTLPDTEKDLFDVEDSMTPGYDVVGIKSIQDASKLVVGQQMSKDKADGGKKENSLAAPAKVFQYEDMDNIPKADEPPPAYPAQHTLCYEEVDQPSIPYKVSSHKIGYEDVDSLLPSDKKKEQFQIKVAAAPQPEGKREDTGDPPGNARQLYSTINKPKPIKARRGNNSPPNVPLPTYSLVNKPKKKKKSAVGTPTTPMSDDRSEEAKTYKTAEVPFTSTEPVAKVIANLQDNFDENIGPYKNVARSAMPMDQPLYSNCREIEEMKDADLGDVSSREPAPPPIPIRSYSEGWAGLVLVNKDEVSGGSTEKSMSPE